MDEFIDAVVEELEREADKHPKEKLHKLYSYKEMIDKRIGQVMERESKRLREKAEIGPRTVDGLTHARAKTRGKPVWTSQGSKDISREES